jgi:hypothetical protein
VTPEDNAKLAPHDQQALAWGQVFMGAITTIVANADPNKARNYVAVTIEGVHAPFDRVVVELYRPGGKPSSDVARDAKKVARLAISLLKDLCPEGHEMRGMVNHLASQLPNEIDE